MTEIVKPGLVFNLSLCEVLTGDGDIGEISEFCRGDYFGHLCYLRSNIACLS